MTDQEHIANLENRVFAVESYLLERDNSVLRGAHMEVDLGGEHPVFSKIIDGISNFKAN